MTTLEKIGAICANTDAKAKTDRMHAMVSQTLSYTDREAIFVEIVNLVYDEFFG